MPEFWLGLIVGVACCVAIVGGYAIYRLVRLELQERSQWDDQEDTYYDRNGSPPVTVNRDPLAPPFPPQAAGDPGDPPIIHDVRWTRGYPRKD